MDRTKYAPAQSAASAVSQPQQQQNEAQIEKTAEADQRSECEALRRRPELPVRKAVYDSEKYEYEEAAAYKRSNAAEVSAKS